MKPPAPPAQPGDQRAGSRPRSSASSADSPPPPGIDEDRTGLPGVKTWPRVYILVFGLFILWVALLTALTRFFS